MSSITAASNTWLSLWNNEGEAILVERKQAYKTLDLAQARKHYQRPLVVCCIGSKTKSNILEAAGIAKCLEKEYIHQGIRLWSDPKRLNKSAPLLFMDAELHVGALSIPQIPSNYPPIERRRVDFGVEVLPVHFRRVVADEFYGRVLSPFISIYCYFSADLGGLKGLVKTLARQFLSVLPPQVPRESLPHLLVIHNQKGLSTDISHVEEELRNSLVLQLRQLGNLENDDAALFVVFQHIRGINVVDVSTCPTYKLQAHRFYERILDEVDACKGLRIASGTHFNVHDFEALLSLSLDSFARQPKALISLIHACRIHNPVSPHLEQHAIEFLRICKDAGRVWELGLPLLASTITLDCTAPGTPLFPARLVFEELYAPRYTQVAEAFQEEDPNSVFMHKLQKLFESNYDEVFKNCTRNSAAALHQKQLLPFQSELALLKSHTTCFCCLMRMPEKVLSCGHSLCNMCIKIYGRQCPTKKYMFKHATCILCGATNLTPFFQFIPPTAGIRVLTIDGGGIRGIVPLVILSELEESLSGLGVSTFDLFDFSAATSSGSYYSACPKPSLTDYAATMSLFGMFLKKWSAKKCIEIFETTSKYIFKRRCSGDSLISKLHELFISFLRDCKYDANRIEHALTHLFGSETLLFNPLTTETKIAITATTTKNTRPCLFTNYNGGPRPLEQGYTIIRQTDPRDNISLADAARCSTAAPWYFPPREVNNLETFQDGGLWLNNPLPAAVWETKFLWDDKGAPDIALSLGSGRSKALPFIYGQTSPTKRRFLPRLVNTLYSYMDGDKAYNELLNTLSCDWKDRFHRLNPLIPGREVELDDTSKFDKLRDNTICYLKDNSSLKPIIDALYATLFYFELDEYPVWEQNQYWCTGHIYCRLNLSNKGKEFLYDRLQQTKSFFIVNGRPTPCVKNVSKCTPPFRRRIQFAIDSLNDLVSISIRGISSQAKCISGLPKSCIEIVRAQRLNHLFGSADHEPLQKLLPELPRKRKRSSL